MTYKLTLIAFILTLSSVHSQGITRFKVANSGISSLVVGDFDKDGDDDVIGINYGFFTGISKLELIENKNNGLKNLEAITIMNGYMPGSNILSYDYDNDGDLDLIFGEKGANMNVLINKGSFSFEKLDLKVPVLNNIVLIDMDQDSDMDMIGYANNTKLLNFYINNGNNNYTASNIQPFSKNIATMDAADLNGDGKVEILIGIKQFFDEHILLLKNSGPNKYDTVHIANNNFRNVNSIQLIDINRDGIKDILACNADDGIGAWINKGNLKFEYKKLVSYTQSSSFGFLKFIATDLNGDGHLDLVSGNNSDGIQMHINTNKTTLTYDTKDVTSIAPCYTLVACNLDKDKDNDFFVSNSELWICENNIDQLTGITESANVNSKGYIITNGVLSLLDEDLQNCEVEIWNMSGQMVKKQSIVNGSMQIASLLSGSYYLKCVATYNDQIVSRTYKIVVN